MDFGLDRVGGALADRRADAAALARFLTALRRLDAAGAPKAIAARGRLVGVIDWGLSAIGDPATDAAAAWSWVAPAERALFLERLELDDDALRRARLGALWRGHCAEPLSRYDDHCAGQPPRDLAANGGATALPPRGSRRRGLWVERSPIAESRHELR